MAKANTIGGIVLFLFGAYYTYEAFKLPLWTDVGPGAGALPVVCGSLFLIFSFILTVKSSRGVTSDSGAETVFTRWRTPVTIFGLLFISALLAKTLGVLVVIYIFSVLYMVIVERIRLLSALFISLGITLIFYVVFQLWLDVPLSMGDLELWLNR